MSTRARLPSSAPATAAPVVDGAPPGRPRLNRPVFLGSSLGIIAIVAWASLAPTAAADAIGAAVAWVSESFGWYYIAVVTLVVGFVVVVAASRAGRTRLGPDDSRPAFNYFTWSAMLFAAGIGIDLMFFSVSEPITQYLAPPTGDGSTVEAARQAMVLTLFHYGLTGWALYALMGMAFGYFAYRHNLPLSIRSALHPIFGKRIHGPIGHAVDIAAVLGTIFGIATTLGIGVAQLNFGLDFMFGIPEGLAVQACLIALSVIMAAVSVLTGVEKGIRRLSELNVLCSIALMLFVLFAGRTSFLMDAIVQNVGDVLSRFPAMTLETFAYDRPDAWLSSWTLFFWAWWIAWAPFVGLFLARISRGRTIREFVIGTMVVPFAFILLWISIFGNSALDLVMGGDSAFGDVAMNTPERAFYSLLAEYPGVPLTAAVATFTGLLFYVTSADSGALVMANLTSHLPDADTDGPKWLRLFWAVATGALTLVMLAVGGVPTLQSATVVMGLPFSVVLLLIMLGLYKALKVEGSLARSYRSSLPGILSGRSGDAGHGRSWRQRLARSMTYPDRDRAQRFAQDVALPALTEVHDELIVQGAVVRLVEGEHSEHGIRELDLEVSMGEERDFRYAIRPVRYDIPTYAPHAAAGSEEHYYRMEVFSLEGSRGYDVLDYTREQVIADVLDHYETHLEFLHLNRDDPGNTVVVAPDQPERTA
ncbi:choline BCCT transporter BetT [Clavibacter michiganensis]|uniref:High-affinity choline/glycine/betaine transport protein, BCCT family n=1 Tax=Clavibacter michiganensis subsp. michiganensis (strain NCPPB 382) TaxID=443906 RepID=A5CSE4_CLAM3|nr:choline BCCT transporter BetT [Clavibacter michiganensis]MDO4029735.1 choline BCCT transporter BetT [Clavibacter michiganensis]MWJ19942.1 high-affinity choline transporter BetT [Clavibacter michiganensis subsp. michiganensis]MWJ34003.1 high-affinity choline transporter BetT [Clavibacter michiganensis subsp. michiganensis]MWJ80394.1 high-affinity choline transporter BetT [Clavibacter michiganensis subsp. michiganensis]UOW02683.1 choline BCCT transporter BetT [Clavibacter michiganensis subsp.